MVLLLVEPFLPILLWSVVLTVAFQPAHAWLTARLGGRGWLAAAAITVLALAVAIGPATVLVTSAIHSLELLARWIGAGHHDLPDPPQRDRRPAGRRPGDRPDLARRRRRTSRPSSAATAAR